MIIDAGYQLDREGFEFLKNLPEEMDIKSFIANMIERLNGDIDRPSFISRELLEKEILRIQPFKEEELLSEGVGKTSHHPYAKDVEADIKIIKDPTKDVSAKGLLKDYVKYFQDRYRKIRKIMNGRLDARDAGTITEAKKAPEGSEIKFICILTDKRESKLGIFLYVEDDETATRVFVPAHNHDALTKARRLTLDAVLCIVAKKTKTGLMTAKDIIFPDIPVRKPKTAPIPVSAALISDLHIGSKMFMVKPFKRFIKWLRGELTNPHLRDLSSHVKYVIIAGDIVDGVGVYPQQIRELQIKDICKQYKYAAKILEQIPEHIEVIIIPGNHDASRRALPQPSIPKEYAEPLYESRQIYSLGDPSLLALHGVTMLLTHGRSLDDIISCVSGMSFRAPDEAMKLLLQYRHLAPTYGLRTLIAPEEADHLVIETVPDIFHAGHVHMMSYSNYRGVLLVNSGAWQMQTEYQKEMGHIPNPGIVPLVNLKDLSVTVLDFATNI